MKALSSAALHLFHCLHPNHIVKNIKSHRYENKTQDDDWYLQLVFNYVYNLG